ncbi:hypothetical protein NECAME_17287 [Necator americanus]|uniref:EGF-like domain-containing protein n=1 Tax=Necator americanus TaxID=51031 RepID=W2TQR5_NECAM|nr:hypothetical protein NECAME_17287 [Necator americanus]ETN84019.1 hypothetical protein NECAME_17287 [Necator americanus]
MLETKQLVAEAAGCISRQDYTVDINDYKCECDYGYTGDDCADTTKTTTTTLWVQRHTISVYLYQGRFTVD